MSNGSPTTLLERTEGIHRVRKLTVFTLVSMVGIVSPLVALPAVTSRFGADAWAAIAVGQAVGLTAGVIVELGWAFNGPQRVSRQRAVNARDYLVLSTLTKLVVFVPASAAAAVIAALIAPSEPVLAALTAISAASLGLSISWYFIGRDNPLRIFVTDSLVRLAGMALASALIVGGGSSLLYPAVGILLPGLIAPIVGLLSERVRGDELASVGWRRVRHAMGAQRTVVTGRLISALYISLPVPIVGVIAPLDVALFGAADRLTRMSLSVLSAVPNAMQAWVGQPAIPSDRRRRAWAAIGLNVGLGIVAGSCYLLLSRAASELIFSGVATLDAYYSTGGAVLILVVCTSRATGNLGLVAFSITHYVALSALLGSLVGLPLVVALAVPFGGNGALAGVLIAEIVVLSVQLTGLARQTRRIA